MAAPPVSNHGMIRARKPYGIQKLKPNMRNVLKITPSSFSSKDGACTGCGGALALRLASTAINFEADRALWQADENSPAVRGSLGVMLTEHTGCMQVAMTGQDTSAWMDTTGRGLVRSMMHNSFSDGSSTMIDLSLAQQTRAEAGTLNRPFYFWSFAGDGAYTIGAGQISSFFQHTHGLQGKKRGLLIVYDNGGYMNTGGQVSATTLPFIHRTTTPLGKVIPGNQLYPRDLLQIAAAHSIPFAATASLANPALRQDFMDKVRYAINIPAPTFIHVDAPCPKEQGFGEDKTLEVARLAVESGLFPVVSYHQYHPGKVRMSIDFLRSKERTGRQTPISKFFAMQGKSRHLATPEYREALQVLENHVDHRYGWFLDWAGYEARTPTRKNRKLVGLREGIEPPSIYLPKGEEVPVRTLEEF